MITDNGLDIHLSESMVEAIRARGGRTSAAAITDSVKQWNGLLSAGEIELAQALTAQELEEAVAILTSQAKADRLNYREFWGMSTERLCEIVRMHKENIAHRMVRLGELAGMALKARVGGVIVFPPGTGGRPRKS